LWEQFNCEVRKLAEVSKQVAEQFSLKFVPLQKEFDKASSDGDTRYWSVDGIHPTSAGHQIIKEELQKAIEEML
jgi:lysophospholipase L1-like esterase